MALRFRERETTQAAAHLLTLHRGEMPYLKLIKLLYFAERRALVDTGRPITYDRYVSMPHGPVLSRTYDLLMEEPEPGVESYWHRYISVPSNYSVHVLGKVPTDRLSRAQQEVLGQVFAEYGHFDKWKLRDLSHELPEWRDPDDSSLPLPIREILLAQGDSEDDAGAIEQELEAEAIAERLLA